jgi:hypothetical protein
MEKRFAAQQGLAASLERAQIYVGLGWGEDGDCISAE